MSNFYVNYPASAGGSANASVGPNGSVAPTSSTEVGGINPSGNLQPLQTDAAGNLLVNINAETGAPIHVIVDSSALPTGASTSALQTSGNASLTTIASDMTNGTQVTQITGTVPLPTGASTAALQTSGNASLTSIDTKTPALGQVTSANSSPVVIASDQSAVPVKGNAVVTTGTVSSATDVFPAVDVSAFGSISLQLIITGTATVTFQGSNDGVNFRAVAMVPTSGSGAASTVALSSSILSSPVEYKFFKPTVTSYSNGSITGTMMTSQGSMSDPGLRSVAVTNQVPVVGTGTAGTPAGGVLSVQGVASGTALPVSLASSPLPTGGSTAALQSSVQGSVAGGTAATASDLAGGVFNTTLPTLTNGQQASLQLDSSGHLVTNGRDLTPATQNITIVDSVSATATGFNNQPLITGTPTAGSAASFAVTSQESLALEVSGTWTGSLQFEVSVDGGTTWTPHGVHQFGSPNFVTVITANFIASLNMAGKTNFRARATAAMTGTATVKVVTSVYPSTIYIANSLKLIDSTASASPVGMTIKGGSVAALTTDSAIVVATSPNNITSVNQTSSGTSTVTSVAGSATSVQLLALNTSRRMATFFNDSSAILYLKLGVTASTTSYTVQIPANGYYELPYKSFTGEIDGIWASAAGSVRITELT